VPACVKRSAVLPRVRLRLLGSPLAPSRRLTVNVTPYVPSPTCQARPVGSPERTEDLGPLAETTP
jgi:hypothetical protein